MVLVVIPMSLARLTLPDVTTSLCSITGALGQLFFTYSLHVQCLTLYANVRIVITVSPDSKAAVGLVRLTIISVACLAVDTCLVVYLSAKYGVVRKVLSVGYCFYFFQPEPDVVQYRSNVLCRAHSRLGILVHYILHCPHKICTEKVGQASVSSSETCVHI